MLLELGFAPSTETSTEDTEWREILGSCQKHNVVLIVGTRVPGWSAAQSPDI